MLAFWRANFLVFSGTLDYRPNVDALVWFCQRGAAAAAHTLPQSAPAGSGQAPSTSGAAARARWPPCTYGEVADAAHIYCWCVCVRGADAHWGRALGMLSAFALEAPVVSTHMGAEGL